MFETAYTWDFELTYFFPHFAAVAFVVFLLLIKQPAKIHEFFRALLALLIATVLAHLDRWLNLWPEHPFFASGHMTFCAGIAVSMGVLRPQTLAFTIPILVGLGLALYVEGFHSVIDIVGAFPTVAISYGLVYMLWKIPAPPAPSLGGTQTNASAPLDIPTDSP